MVRRDGAETRKERMLKIKTHIHGELHQNKEPGFIPLKKTIVFLSIETGLTKMKIREYLEDISEVSGQFEIDSENDQIRYPKGV